MKKIIYLVLVLFLASCGSDNTSGLSSAGSQEVGVSSARGGTTESILSAMENGTYKEGELIVKFRSGVVAASSSKTNQAVGATSLKRFSIVPNLERVKLPAGLSVRDAIKQYMDDPNVEYAEPNYLKRSSMTPNDPFFPQQWGMTVVEAPEAWDITTGSSNVIVAVLDTGLDSTHPDFAGNVIQGENFVAVPHNTDTTDDNGHGTHVSGIIGAVGNNGVGVAGLMWGVRIMPVKFLDANGTGFTSDEIEGIDFAIAHGAKIINASFAGGGFDRSEYDAVAQANAAGVLLMAAAGNGSGSFCDQLPGTNIDSSLSPCYPASFSNPNDSNLMKAGLPALPNIISVASTSQSDALSSFSNFGPGSVQVAAPGINILSTVPLSLTSPFCDGGPEKGYEFCSGTSMSTPFVSGLAGLVYSHNPNLSHTQVRSVILNTVDPLPSLSGKITTGGRINAFRAITFQTVPKISVSPASNDFGSINVGSSSLPQTFTVSNQGTANLLIGQITLTGSDAGEFGLRNDGCSGQTIGLQLSCTIQATFSPASAGTKNASISIPSNDTASPTATISLTGSGVNPSPSGGGGGGCSIGSKDNTPTAVADGALLLIPAVVLVLLRRRRL
jgi:thermitase